MSRMKGVTNTVIYFDYIGNRMITYIEVKRPFMHGVNFISRVFFIETEPLQMKGVYS